MPLLFCLLAQTLTRAANVPRETLELSRNWYPSAAQSCNCFSCFWSDATVLVALLVVNTKGRSPQKGHLWPRNYTPCVQLCQEFCRDFSKNFSPHSAHNPETRRTLRCIAWDKSRTILNCRLFAFALKMILNLILKTNLKTVSNSKTVLNLILNLKMFHVTRNRAKGET